MDTLEAVVNRDRGAFDSYRVNGDVLRQKYLQGIFIAGRRTLFSSIADDEDDLPVFPGALREIACGQQDGIIQYVRHLGRGAYRVYRLVNRYPVDVWTLRTQGTAGDWNPVICPAVALDLVQHRRQFLATRREIRDPGRRAAIGVNGNFVELAERPRQR